MDFFGVSVPTLDKIGALGTMIGFAALVITDRLVWHTRLDKAEKDRDRWQAIAIEALTGSAQASVRTAEVAVDVISSLPDPAGKG